jgi:hypothetical protein
LTGLSATAALEAFERLFQLVAIEKSVFVSVASVEHPLHLLGHFFAAEFAVFVLVKAHDPIEKLVDITGTTAFSTTWWSATFSATAAFTRSSATSAFAVAWRAIEPTPAAEVWTQFVLREFSVFVLIQFGQSVGSVLNFLGRDHVISVGVQRHHDRIRRRPEASSFATTSTFSATTAVTFASRWWTAITVTFSTRGRTAITAAFSAGRRAVTAFTFRASLTIARTLTAARWLSNNG